MKPLSPKQRAWLEEFEVLNGRKPTPKEMKQAFDKLEYASSGKVREFSNQAKIIISLVVLGLLIIITVLMLQLKEQQSQASLASSTSASTSVNSSVHSTSKSSSKSSSTTSSSSSQSVGSTDEAYNSHQETSYWNSSKASQLADFMENWGNQMKQPGYKEIPINLPIYWQDGSKLSSDWSIADAYEYWYGGNSVHRYIFVINSSGQTQVLYSQDTNGSAYYVKETQNADLSDGFAKIVSGN